MPKLDADYAGARFYKCDLHMHTPSDSRHWLGAPMSLTTEADKQNAAEAFVRRCYEEALEVIAITDHNFASKSFFPFLISAAQKLSGEYGYRLVIFPGFEIMADVGKGVHVLAIFDPDTDLDEVTAMLTSCGVPYPHFEHGGIPSRSKKRLPDILQTVQRKNEKGEWKGLVICPHAPVSDGLFDNEKIAEWLQQDEFRNSDLLCIEVPKPPKDMSKNWQTLLSAGPGCEPAWRRERSISCIMSSDAKALMKSDQASGNHIGYRYTWIKMGTPSIEGLRQAFLDHQSRVRLQSGRPEDAYDYAKIRNITIADASFLSNQTIALSPNLTAIIGGRGTGKSTIVEYIRHLLNQNVAPASDKLQRNVAKIKNTMVAETTLRLAVEKEGQLLTFEAKAGQPSALLEEPEVTDIPRFFPASVIGQGEVYAIAEDSQARTRLLDDAVRSELDAVSRDEEGLLRSIRTINQQLADEHGLQNTLRQLETEKRDLELKIVRLNQLEQPLASWRARLQDRHGLETIDDYSRAVAQTIKEVATGLEFPSAAAGLLAERNTSQLQGIFERAHELLEDLRTSLLQAATSYELSTAELLSSPEVNAWREREAEATAEYEALRAELQAQGTDPAEYLKYQERLSECDIGIDEMKKKLHEINEQKRFLDREPDSNGQPGLIQRLHELWRKSSKFRKDAAVLLQAGVPVTKNNKPFVEVTVQEFADVESFVLKMRPELKDKRRVSEEDWDTFMRAVMDQALTSGQVPLEVLRRWVQDLRVGLKPDNCPWEVGDRRTKYLVDRLTEDLMSELRLWRVPDKVQIRLFRQDGSFVGELDGPELSAGQRCTAVLALLLARDQVPIIIDQPEEDLDNEFIFRELVPLLRKMKEKRQIIVVTHNANIPVNGDAELVVSLEVRDGKGYPKEVHKRVAIGSLDNRIVKQAVEDIMEGSEEAFRRRFEKYGF